MGGGGGGGGWGELPGSESRQRRYRPSHTSNEELHDHHGWGAGDVGRCGKLQAKAADTVSLSEAELLIGGSTAGRVGGRPGEINNNKWFFWNLFSSSLRVFTIQVCGSGQD